MKQVTTNLYKFAKLTGGARERAIEDYRDFLLRTYDSRNLEKSGWSEDEIDADYDDLSENDERVIESIDANEHLFFRDGTLTPSFGTEVTIHDETYKMED